MSMSITADEAGKMAAAANVKNLDGIFDVIRKAAAQGKYSCYWYESITKQEREHLNSLGFIVGKEQQDRDGLLIEIRWR